jgi:hypothetical protein
MRIIALLLLIQSVSANTGPPKPSGARKPPNFDGRSNAAATEEFAIGKDVRMDMDGQLKVEAQGKLDIDEGGRVDFGKPADGSRHKIGGKGMEAKGRVDVKKDAVIEMIGQLKLEGEGRLNISRGGRVDFEKPADGSRHKIGGKGISCAGEIVIVAGAGADITSVLVVTDEGVLSTASDSDVAFVDEADVVSASRRLMGGRSQTNHRIGGKGVKHTGKMTMKRGHRVYSSNFTSQRGAKLVRVENGAELNTKAFRHDDGEMVVNEGGVIVMNGSNPIRFYGGKMRGKGGKFNGKVELKKGARIAPGDPDDADSMGKSKLSVEGDLEIEDTTDVTYEATVAEDSSDSVEVTGKATLAGKIKLSIKKRGKKARKFVLMRAGRGINGTFSGCDGCGKNDKFSVGKATTASGRRNLQAGSAMEVSVEVAAEETPGGGETGDGEVITGNRADSVSVRLSLATAAVSMVLAFAGCF